MASQKLQDLIARRRAAPYDPSQSVEFLRGPKPDGGSVPRENTTVEAVDANGVPCEWVIAGEPSTDVVFIYLHGGGYDRSTAVASRRIASDLSHHCNCRSFTVEYRLAPEHPFPAAVDDALTAYRWLIAQGTPADKIVFGGGSAGGGLSAALMAKLKETGEAQPGGAVLLSPWVDLSQSSETFVTNADTDPTISKQYLDRMSGYYLNGTDPKDPIASPLFSDLSDLPPILIQVGNLETMYGESIAYAQKAVAAGVTVVFEPYDDVIHGWHNQAYVIPDIPESLLSLDRIGNFIRSYVS